MDPTAAGGIFETLAQQLKQVEPEYYYDLLLLTFLLLPIYMLIRLGFYLFHWLKNKRKHIDIAI